MNAWDDALEILADRHMARATNVRNHDALRAWTLTRLRGKYGSKMDREPPFDRPEMLADLLEPPKKPMYEKFKPPEPVEKSSPEVAAAQFKQLREQLGRS